MDRMVSVTRVALAVMRLWCFNLGTLKIEEQVLSKSPLNNILFWVSATKKLQNTTTVVLWFERNIIRLDVPLLIPRSPCSIFCLGLLERLLQPGYS